MAIDYTIKAIPTVYKNRRYRSRLEAKWAAFFDLCLWDAEYEPTDFGSWSPDFSIQGAFGLIMVEVKPISELHHETAEKMVSAAADNAFTGELLLLGVSPIGDKYLGWLNDNPEPDVGCFSPAPFAWYSARPTQIDFCHGEQSFYGRITGLYDGGSYGSCAPEPGKSVRELWAQASNIVQWLPK